MESFMSRNQGIGTLEQWKIEIVPAVRDNYRTNFDELRAVYLLGLQVNH